MDEIEKEGLAAIARSPRFQQKINKALDLIRESYQQGLSYVAYSCGKDSAVVLHLVQQVDPLVPALFCSTEQKNYLDNDEDVIRRQIQKGGRIQETMLTPYNWAPNLSIQEILNPPKNSTKYLGLRKSESPARRIALCKFGLTYEYKGGGGRVCPIANWSDTDVWTYIARYDLPYLSFYDSISMRSRRSRTSVFVGTGRDNSRMAEEIRSYIYKHSPSFRRWEEENSDIVRLMRCFWELSRAQVSGPQSAQYLQDQGVPISDRRLAQLDDWAKHSVRHFCEAKTLVPYLSMATWALYKQIYEVENDETIDGIIDQLRP